MIEGVLHSLQTVLRDLAEKLQGHMVVLRFLPVHRKFTFPQDSRSPIDSVALLLRQVQCYEKTHGRDAELEEGVEEAVDDKEAVTAVLEKPRKHMAKSYRDGAKRTTGHVASMLTAGPSERPTSSTSLYPSTNSRYVWVGVPAEAGPSRSKPTSRWVG